MLIPQRALALAAGCAVILGIFGVAAQASPPPKRCGYFDPLARIYIACAAEPGTTSNDAAPATGQQMGDGNDSSDGDTSDAQCDYTTLESPPPWDPSWSLYLPAGADPANFQLEMSSCDSRAGNTGEVFAVPVRHDPPPSASVVAREAVAKLPVPLPAIQVGPNIHRVAVNIPVWLWVSNPEAVTASSTDRTVTVTATATLGSVTWSMGEPDAKPVICQGGGVAPWPGADLWHPPCGYTYRLRSLPSRTDGAGVWPVTATASWAITWRANTGQSGTDSVTTRSTLGLNVGEYRTVIVAGNG